jgi:hypothetical protein
MVWATLWAIFFAPTHPVALFGGRKNRRGIGKDVAQLLLFNWSNNWLHKPLKIISAHANGLRGCQPFFFLQQSINFGAIRVSGKRQLVCFVLFCSSEFSGKKIRDERWFKMLSKKVTFQRCTYLQWTSYDGTVSSYWHLPFCLKYKLFLDTNYLHEWQDCFYRGTTSKRRQTKHWQTKRRQTKDQKLKFAKNVDRQNIDRQNVEITKTSKDPKRRQTKRWNNQKIERSNATPTPRQRQNGRQNGRRRQNFLFNFRSIFRSIQNWNWKLNWKKLALFDLT